MGGKGSGSYFRPKRVATTDSMLDFDLRSLKKLGLLNTYGAKSIRWKHAGKLVGDICFGFHEDCIELRYTFTDYKNDEQKIQIVDPIKLVKHPCNYGGFRYYFKCPDCGRQTLVLYGGKYFRCRMCQKLTIPSAIESKFERAVRQYKKIIDQEY